MDTTSTGDDMMMMMMGDCPMIMYFHWNMQDCVLFYQWHPTNPWQYSLTLVILFLMCIIREFIIYIGKWYELKTLHPHKFLLISNKFWITGNDVKYFTSKVYLKNTVNNNSNNNHSNSKSTKNSKKNDDAGLLTAPISINDVEESVSSRSGQIWYNNGYPLYLRVSDGITFGLSLLFGYWLMLVVMTYNGMSYLYHISYFNNIKSK